MCFFSLPKVGAVHRRRCDKAKLNKAGEGNQGFESAAKEGEDTTRGREQEDLGS